MALTEDSCRKRLTSYEVYTLRKAKPFNNGDLQKTQKSTKRSEKSKRSIPTQQTWTWTWTKETFDQEDILKDILALNKKHPYITEKKSQLDQNTSIQVNKLFDEKNSQEYQQTFTWTLSQLTKTKRTKTLVLYLKRAPRQGVDTIALYRMFIQNRSTPQGMAPMNGPGIAQGYNNQFLHGQRNDNISSNLVPDAVGGAYNRSQPPSQYPPIPPQEQSLQDRNEHEIPPPMPPRHNVSGRTDANETGVKAEREPDIHRRQKSYSTLSDNDNESGSVYSSDASKRPPLIPTGSLNRRFSTGYGKSPGLTQHHKKYSITNGTQRHSDIAYTHVDLEQIEAEAFAKGYNHRMSLDSHRVSRTFDDRARIQDDLEEDIQFRNNLHARDDGQFRGYPGQHEETPLRVEIEDNRFHPGDCRREPLSTPREFIFQRRRILKSPRISHWNNDDYVTTPNPFAPLRTV